MEEDRDEQPDGQLVVGADDELAMLSAPAVAELVEREVAHRTAAFEAQRRQIEALLEQADEELDEQLNRVQALETQCARQEGLLQRERDLMRHLEEACERLEGEVQDARSHRAQAVQAADSAKAAAATAAAGAAADERDRGRVGAQGHGQGHGTTSNNGQDGDRSRNSSESGAHGDSDAAAVAAAASLAEREAAEAQRLQDERDAAMLQLQRLQSDMAAREGELSRARLALARQLEAQREAQQRARRAAAQTTSSHTVAAQSASLPEDEFFDCEDPLTPEERRLADAVSATTVCAFLQGQARTVADMEAHLLAPLGLDKAGKARARSVLGSVLRDLEQADRIMPQLGEDCLLFHLRR